MSYTPTSPAFGGGDLIANLGILRRLRLRKIPKFARIPPFPTALACRTARQGWGVSGRAGEGVGGSQTDTEDEIRDEL
jgi:hypothetical protein